MEMAMTFTFTEWFRILSNRPVDDDCVELMFDVLGFLPMNIGISVILIFAFLWTLRKFIESDRVWRE